MFCRTFWKGGGGVELERRDAGKGGIELGLRVGLDRLGDLV